MATGIGNEAGWQQAGATVANPSGADAQPQPQQAAPPNYSQQQDAMQPKSPDMSQSKVPEEPTQPMVLRPKRGGLLGVVDKIADALTGSTRPEIYTDEQGNEFVQHHTISRGAQWAKIGAEALHGAAAGLAAGKGAGNMGKGALAGWEAGAQDAQKEKDNETQMDDKAQADMVNRANYQMLQMKLAEQGWRNARLQTDADQKDIEFSQGQIDRFVKEGGQVLGTAAHPGDIQGILKTNPTTMEDLIKHGTIQIVPSRTPDGHMGVTVIKMPSDYRTKMLPTGAVFHTFDPVNHVMVEHKSSDPMTQGEADDYDAKASADQLKWTGDKKEQDLKDAQAKNQNSEATNRDLTTPVENDLKKAQTNEANARANQIHTGQLNPDGTNNPRFELLAQALYSGDILRNDLTRVAKGEGFEPNAITARAVEIGQQNGRPWSESIIKQEMDFAKNEKTQAALDGIDRVINPSNGYMKILLDRAQDAGLTNYGAYNSLALGGRRAYGEATAKNLNTAIGEARRSISGLIGNPLLGGGETDKKLEAAEDLLGKSPTMANLKSAVDLINTALASQKASIIGNNRFLQKRWGNTTAAQPKSAPQNAAGTMQFSDGKLHYVDANHNDLGIAE